MPTVIKVENPALKDEAGGTTATVFPDEGHQANKKSVSSSPDSSTAEQDAQQQHEPDKNAKGGRRERLGYIMASGARGPLTVNAVFWVAAVLLLSSLDSVCDTAPYDGRQCTEYTFVDITFTETALQNITYTAHKNFLGSFQCTPNESPCKHCTPGGGANDTMTCRLLSTPNDFYPCFTDALELGTDYSVGFKEKIPREFHRPLTCDCRGGQARLLSVHGPYPSVIIPASSVVTTVLTLVSIPLFGALTDFTNHRKTVWIVMCFFTMIAAGLMAVLGLKYLWSFSVVMSGVMQICFEFMWVAIGAYLPDFGTAKEIIAVTGTAMTWNASAQLATIIIAVVVIVVMQQVSGPLMGPVVASQIMSTFVVIWFLVFSVPAFCFIQPRSATKRPPEWEGRSLLSLSFLRLFRTVCEAGKKYSETLKYLFYSALMNAWGLSLVQYTTTYFYWQLQMTQLEVTLQAVLVLVTVVLGAFLSGKIVKRVHHKWMHVTICVVYCVVSVFQPTFVHRPSQKAFAYVFASGTGILFGLFYGINAGCFASLVPGGQEAEYMAVLQWFPYSIRWLPGVIYGVLVQTSVPGGQRSCGRGGQNHRWAFFSLAIYPLLALVVMLTIRFDEGEKAIAHTLYLRESSEESAGPDTDSDRTEKQ